MPLRTRRGWIKACESLALARQCKLAGVARSSVYAVRDPASPCDRDLAVLALLDAEYTRHPFYGSRKMAVYLRGMGRNVNRKRVQRLMRVLGLAGMAPGPSTSRPHPQHKIYPYLLRGVTVTRPNQVWSTDISYVGLPHGFVYLVAVIDWYSRKVLAWRLSNTVDSTFCVDCLEQALQTYGAPEIFNTDQGAQFTSQAFTGVLKAHDITISMDGRGRALDNIFVERLWRSVKHEDIYLKSYATLPELVLGLTQYFAFYNAERIHQSLGYRTPNMVYQTANGGGARIVDKFNAGEKRVWQYEPKANRGSAVPLQDQTYPLNVEPILS